MNGGTGIPDVGVRPEQPTGGTARATAENDRAGFWGSMPGVLTALGGLVTAVGTILALYFNAQGGNDTNPPPPSTPAGETTVLVVPAAPAPDPNPSSSDSSRTSDVISGESASSGSEAIIEEWVRGLDSGTATVVEGCAAGYAGDCDDMIEILASQCEAGYAISCDVLYLSSPTGSALESYGSTCGGRYPATNQAWCRDLVS